MILLESTYSCGAEVIEEIIKAQQDLDSTMKETQSLYEGLFSAYQRLERLKNSAALAGWDGDDALPVDLTSFNNARWFLSQTPRGVAAPDPGIDVNGRMTLEWRQSDGRLLSLTFDNLGNVHYIVFLDSDKIYGVRPVSSGYAEKLKDFLEDVIKDKV